MSLPGLQKPMCYTAKAGTRKKEPQKVPKEEVIVVVNRLWLRACTCAGVCVCVCVRARVRAV